MEVSGFKFFSKSCNVNAKHLLTCLRLTKQKRVVANSERDFFNQMIDPEFPPELQKQDVVRKEDDGDFEEMKTERHKS